MTFVRRHIDVEFQLGDSSFDDAGSNVDRITGLRVTAAIQKAGGVSLSQLNLRVFGLDLKTMNKLSTLGKPLPDVRNNTVSVFAYDEGQAPRLVFKGTIQQAWADMGAQPDAVFNVTAYTGLLAQLAPVAPTSYPGQASVDTVMSTFAGQMGLGYENNGVDGQLANPYFSGTVVDQVRAAADQAQIEYLIDDTVLAIWPKGANRNGAASVVSPDTGMINYPQWTQSGISVRTLFNSSVLCGGTITVETSITPANGAWYVYAINHILEAETPGGQWFTEMECSVIGRPIPLAQ